MTLTLERQNSMILIPADILKKILQSSGISSQIYSSQITIDLDEDILFENEIMRDYNIAKKAPNSDFINI